MVPGQLKIIKLFDHFFYQASLMACWETFFSRTFYEIYQARSRKTLFNLQNVIQSRKSKYFTLTQITLLSRKQTSTFSKMIRKLVWNLSIFITENSGIQNFLPNDNDDSQRLKSNLRGQVYGTSNKNWKIHVLEIYL